MIMLLVTVALVMAAMMLAMTMPVLAAPRSEIHGADVSFAARTIPTEPCKNDRLIPTDPGKGVTKIPPSHGTRWLQSKATEPYFPIRSTVTSGGRWSHDCCSKR